MYASVETKKPLYAMPDHFNFTRTFFPVNDCKNGFGLIGTNDGPIGIVYEKSSRTARRSLSYFALRFCSTSSSRKYLFPRVMNYYY